MITVRKRKIQRVVLLPDIHHPYQDQAVFNAILKFIKWFKPDEVNITGDGMNMDAVNHWKMQKGDKKFFEGKRLLQEYKAFDNDILTPLEEILPPGTKKTYMGGNHEHWVTQLLQKFPNLIGFLEVPIALKLKERGWEWIPYIQHDEETDNYVRGIKQYGKLLVFHGENTNKFHAAKTADTFSMSCAYCHTHDIQLYTKVTVDDWRGFHTAQTIGCISKRSPEFMRGKQNKWVNAFGVLYVRESGHFNLYVPVIVNGQFVFGNKKFNGNSHHTDPEIERK